MEKYQLRYDKIAETFKEALPLGNGSLGAMIYGGTDKETIAFNEETFWAGYQKDTDNPQAGGQLTKVRELVLMGDYEKAQDIIENKMLSDFNQPYQPLAAMHLDFMQSGDTNSYCRKLQMDQGIVSVHYRNQDTGYQREYFCSYPDQVMVITISADKRGAVNFSLHLDNVCPYNCFPIGKDSMGIETNAPSEVRVGDVYHFFEDNTITYDDKKETIKGYLTVKADLEDGELFYEGDMLEIRNSSKVILYVAAATTFSDKQALDTCKKRILLGSRKGYAALRAAHLEDFGGLFKRVELSINGNVRKPTSVTTLLENCEREEDADFLTELLFQYGRYLMISSSRKGSMPPNLQGIWNDLAVPPWWSNFTMNINLQMNYWPVYRCNLEECAQPYLDFIKKVSEKGRKTANAHYRCGGWTSHHMMDIWMNTAPVGYSGKIEKDSAAWAQWNMSAPWLCLDLWEYYRYTKNQELLKKEIFPIMTGCAEFLMDWIFIQDGVYRTAPSTSPENIFILEGNKRCAVCESTAMDMEILGEFFKALVEVCKLLEIGEEQTLVYQDILDKLAPVKVGKEGQILEWGQEFPEEDSGHRHFSMLYSLYPGHGFTKENNRELYQAAEVSLRRRMAHGGGGTGWSRVWAICLWARLGQGQEAYDLVLKFLKEDVFSNLFGFHPPDIFQIDCNFGFTAAIAEMLVQEENGRILPLPALPKAWRQGVVKGIKLAGGSVLAIQWEHHRPIQMVIYAASSGNCEVKAEKAIGVSVRGEAVPYVRQGENIIFSQKKGEEYVINYEDSDNRTTKGNA